MTRPTSVLQTCPSDTFTLRITPNRRWRAAVGRCVNTESLFKVFSSSPEEGQHLLRWSRVKTSAFISIPLFSTRSSICPSGHYGPLTFSRSISWRKPKTSHFLFYNPGPFFASNERLMRLFSSALVHHLPHPPTKPVWFHRGRSDRMSKAEGGGRSPRDQEELG